MRLRWVTWAAVAWLTGGAWLAGGGTARALDMVRTIDGRSPIPCSIASMSPLEVDLTIGQGSRKIPVNEIASISYDSEPAMLSNARTAVGEGRYADALAALEKVNPDEQSRAEIRQDIEFYTAYCRAKLALGGSGEVAAAGKQMAAFVNTYKNSYHWLQANEVVGDLCLAVRAYDQAERYYAEVGKAPWPDYQMRAGVAIGRARLAQGQTAEALDAFNRVLTNDVPGDLADAQRLAATVGKSTCLAADKQYDEAIQLATDAIAKIKPEQVELLSRAYNAQGAALKQAGRLDEARMAYLHVDALYFSVPETHAEALTNLVELWEKKGKPDRAARARETLEERYKSTVPGA